MAGESKSSRLLLLVLGLSVGWSDVVVAQQSGTDVLSSEARQVAQDIGVAKLLDSAPGNRDLDSAGAVKVLLVRQLITERVMGASLAIDGVDAVIDYEIEQNRA